LEFFNQKKKKNFRKKKKKNPGKKKKKKKKKNLLVRSSRGVMYEKVSFAKYARLVEVGRHLH